VPVHDFLGDPVFLLRAAPGDEAETATRVQALPAWGWKLAPKIFGWVIDRSALPLLLDEPLVSPCAACRASVPCDCEMWRGVRDFGGLGYRPRAWDDNETVDFDESHFENSGTETPQPDKAQIAACAAELRVTWPSDRETLMRARKIRLSESHPDHGGSDAEFIRVQEAFKVLRDLT
jgi:hypothetical protein